MQTIQFRYAPSQPLDVVLLLSSGQDAEVTITRGEGAPLEVRLSASRRLQLLDRALGWVRIEVRILAGAPSLTVQLEQDDEIAACVLGDPQRAVQVTLLPLWDEASPGPTRLLGAEIPRDDAEVRVWYATNRRPLDGADPSPRYGADVDDRVHYGTCAVFVPRSHKIGSIGAGWWKRLLRGDDRLQLVSTDALSAPEFWRGVADQFVGERDAVLFVHGYNTTFEQAALRTAQIGFDLQVRGPMAFFSWPSAGRLDEYIVDGNVIDVSGEVLAEFVLGFAEQSGATRVHVIAHSMGTRGLHAAILRIHHDPSQRERARLGQIVLAAADLDAGKFATIAETYTTSCARTTLYVSGTDHAVQTSRWIYDRPRLGLRPPVAVHPRIDTISVTNADLTVLGHDYVATSRPVLVDLHAVMASQPAAQRFGLRGADDGAGPYWILGA